MRLLMVAPPGAGKGTQARKLAAQYHLEHISSGDLFRREVEAGSPLGRQAAAFLARGDLVPDELVGDMIKAAILDAVQRGGYVLDGYPRTLSQAREAYEVARHLEGVELQAVIHLDVDREEVRHRMLARAGAEGRTDDTSITIDHRLDVYDELTRPLLDYYAQRGLVIDVDGDQPIDDVFADIVSAVDALASTGSPTT